MVITLHAEYGKSALGRRCTLIATIIAESGMNTTPISGDSRIPIGEDVCDEWLHEDVLDSR